MLPTPLPSCDTSTRSSRRPLELRLPMNPPALRATTSHESSGSWHSTTCYCFRGNRTLARRLHRRASAWSAAPPGAAHAKRSLKGAPLRRAALCDAGIAPVPFLSAGCGWRTIRRFARFGCQSNVRLVPAHGRRARARHVLAPHQPRPGDPETTVRRRAARKAQSGTRRWRCHVAYALVHRLDAPGRAEEAPFTTPV